MLKAFVEDSLGGKSGIYCRDYLEWKLLVDL